MQYILSLAFRHFKQRDSYSASPTAANGEIIAALYAEVLGVLAQACFLSVKKRFVAEFKEYQNNPSVFVNIIYGMKYLRIKVCTLFFYYFDTNLFRVHYSCGGFFLLPWFKKLRHLSATIWRENVFDVNMIAGCIVYFRSCTNVVFTFPLL